jgi:hypothetical protein
MSPPILFVVLAGEGAAAEYEKRSMMAQGAQLDLGR